jgi:hypothetical protein
MFVATGRIRTCEIGPLELILPGGPELLMVGPAVGARSGTLSSIVSRVMRVCSPHIAEIPAERIATRRFGKSHRYRFPSSRLANGSSPARPRCRSATGGMRPDIRLLVASCRLVTGPETNRRIRRQGRLEGMARLRAPSGGLRFGRGQGARPEHREIAAISRPARALGAQSPHPRTTWRCWQSGANLSLGRNP